MIIPISTDLTEKVFILSFCLVKLNTHSKCFIQKINILQNILTFVKNYVP